MGGKTIVTTGLALALGLGLCLSSLGASAQQMYSWRDAKGVTHFSDQPPPDNVAPRAVARTLGDGKAASNQPALPYALAEAVKRAPVVLYTTAACDACNQGRALLQQRGVPYTEKTVTTNEDQQQLIAAGGDTNLPLLLVGARRVTGFESIGWQEALTAANYPQQSRLPAGWRQGPALAAAPRVVAPPVPRVEAVRQETTPVKPPPANAPPGFQF
jgi:glutaredoxin